MESIQKFQDLLKRLFQFETSDLDFGIYRILNYKRDRIERFIQEDLVDKVETAFAKHRVERLTNINQRFEEAKQKVIEQLEKDAFTPIGDLKEEYKRTRVGRDFLSIKAQKDEAETIDEIKLQVFNDLFNFFSRFYEEGDFVPQYRHSIKGHKYAIPYNGEEVKLYWANNEQYYTKTGLLFRDYTFKANDYKVIFRITSAREELGSKKATKARFFILDDENPVEQLPSPLAGEGKGEGDNKNLIIRFQYRELTEEEVRSYGVEGGSNTAKQEKINQKSYDEILKKVEGIELKAFLSKEYKLVLSKSEGTKEPLLLYQISRFTAKNTKDYFIHKNLKKFLCEQLDYFIKAEVLDIETLEKERFLDKHITRAKVVREIGEDIIDFLSQIEDFQKRLWEKKKFVLKTEYVITTDRVPKEFYEEILKNKEQKKEWKELGFKTTDYTDYTDLHRIKLPIDTEYFGQAFKEKLLEKLTENIDLDDLLDGLLIKSENWQALNLLLGKYKEKVQTIYIDPPFNKEQDADYLYNVKYKDSTWVSILEGRLRLARDMLNDKGSIFVRCDYNGNMYVRFLMNEVFGEGNFRNDIVVNRFKRQLRELTRLNIGTENLFYYGKSQNALVKDEYRRRICTFCGKEAEPQWRPMSSPGLRYPPERVILGKKLLPPKGRHWTFTQERIAQMQNEARIRMNEKISYVDLEGNKIHGLPEYLQSEQTPVDTNWTDLKGYTFGSDFPTENAEELLARAINLSSNYQDLALDFFLGSGTTTAVAHKLKRKWIGIEMGEHFWTVVLPRMKKVLAYDKSGISKEKDVKEKYNEKAAGGFFKYHILEQYEDTLDNIELTPNKQAQLKFGDDYLLKYFLDYETRENPSLLNIDQLKNPFSYKLKVNLEEVGEPQEMIVDILETFNYLLGLKVKKIHPVRCLLSNGVKVRGNQRKYLFVLGEKEGKDIAIVWREYDDNWSEDNFKEDKEFIIKELEPWAPRIVYINGQSILTPKLGKHTAEIRYIEPEFKRLMEV